MLDLAFAVGLGRAPCARTMARVVLFAAALLAGGAGWAQEDEPERTDIVLVLDASGSMFNELDDGRLRITAAKEALATFISRLPESEDLSVGLRVYGSQMMALDPGACEDSLLTVPVGPVDRGLLQTTVRGTEALGATPIAYSLERAAEDLAGATGRKLIVLVTDGEESCGGDVRAVAERLAGAGFDIDLHIIGLALTPEAEQSFAGIGTFQSANSAAELADALGNAVALPEEPVGVPVTVRLTRDGQPATEGATVTFAEALGGGEHAFREVGPGEFEAELPAGTYAALVADAFADAPLSFANLPVTADAENEFAFELAPAFVVELSVAPADPIMGGLVEVTFSGAAAEATAWLTVAPVDAPDDRLFAVQGVSGASGSADVLVPFEEAQLEARYHLVLPEGGSRIAGRSEPFSARRVEASVEAPAEVGSGASFEVAWEGPGNQGDMLTVAVPGSDTTSSLSSTFTVFGNPGTLTAPVDPGSYEIRYLAASGGGVLATAPLEVVASEVGVTAPADVMAGTNVRVSWNGPNGPGDMVVFAPHGSADETFLSYAFTAWGPELDLVAPVEAGAYEVRYLSGSERRALASATVNVTEAVVTIDAPSEVAAGSVFTVSWTGPNGSGDYLGLARQDAPVREELSVAFTAWGATLELTAPETPGTYQVRYVSAFTGTTLATVEIQVR